jgi:hypothetical protein
MNSGALRWAGRVVHTSEKKPSLCYEAPHSFPLSVSHSAEPARKALRIMDFEHEECDTVNDKLLVAQLVKKFPTPYRTLMFKSVSQERYYGSHPQPHKSLKPHCSICFT